MSNEQKWGCDPAAVAKPRKSLNLADAFAAFDSLWFGSFPSCPVNCVLCLRFIASFVVDVLEIDGSDVGTTVLESAASGCVVRRLLVVFLIPVGPWSILRCFRSVIGCVSSSLCHGGPSAIWLINGLCDGPVCSNVLDQAFEVDDSRVHLRSCFCGIFEFIQ